MGRQPRGGARAKKPGAGKRSLARHATNHDYELLQCYLGCDAESFPLRPPSCPPEPEGRSRRLRQRWATKLALWKIACSWVHFLNFLYSSEWHGSQRHFASDSSGNAHHAAEDVLLRQLWRKAKLEREGCRQYRADAGTGGRSAAAELVKNARFQDGYCRILKSPSQVPLCASRVAEPNDDTFVDMLTALPQVEADFCAKDANCIDWTGKSRVIQSELARRSPWEPRPSSPGLAWSSGFRRFSACDFQTNTYDPMPACDSQVQQ